MPTFPSPDFYCPLARIVDDEETVRNSESFTLRVAGIQTVVYESAEDGSSEISGQPLLKK